MKKGTYTYKHLVKYQYPKQYAEHTLRVEILGESEKRYKVKYLAFHANGNRPGYITWVDKDKVAVDGETRVPVNVRLPYKD